MPAGFDSANWIAVGLVAVLGLVALVVAGYLLVGLFDARSLIRRELSAYFLSPLGYVVLVVFLLATGCRFFLTVDQLTASGPRGVDFPMQFLFSILPHSSGAKEQWQELLSGVAFWLIYLLIPPLLTMRLFAEERSTGTLEVLMTSPLRDWQIVLSKYVACFTFYMILWLPTLLYLPVLLDLHNPVLRAAWTRIPKFHTLWTPWCFVLVGGLAAVVLGLLLALLRLGTGWRIVALVIMVLGLIAAGVGAGFNYGREDIHVFEIQAGIDPLPVLSTYLGLALAGAMFLALGMFVSSLVRSQIVAALVSVVLSMGFMVPGAIALFLDFDNPLRRFLYSFNLPQHLSQDFGRGVIDTRHVVLYSSFALFCLFLTVRSVESRRWR